MFVQEKFKFKSKRDTLWNRTSKALKTAWSYLPYWNSSVKQEVDHVISKVWCLHLSYFSIIDKLKGKHVSYHFYKILIYLERYNLSPRRIMFSKTPSLGGNLFCSTSRSVSLILDIELQSNLEHGDKCFYFILIFPMFWSTMLHFACLLRLRFCPLA